MRRAAKNDTAQSGIVEAIEAEGWECFLIRMPCDLLCWHPVLDALQWIEVKSNRKKDGTVTQDKRQQDQIEFLRRTRCPVVTTPAEALEALRRHYRNGKESNPELLSGESEGSEALQCRCMRHESHAESRRGQHRVLPGAQEAETP